jgi:hypothetical protein
MAVAIDRNNAVLVGCCGTLPAVGRFDLDKICDIAGAMYRRMRRSRQPRLQRSTDRESAAASVAKFTRDIDIRIGQVEGIKEIEVEPRAVIDRCRSKPGPSIKEDRRYGTPVFHG